MWCTVHVKWYSWVLGLSSTANWTTLLWWQMMIILATCFLFCIKLHYSLLYVWSRNWYWQYWWLRPESKEFRICLLNPVDLEAFATWQTRRNFKSCMWYVRNSEMHRKQCQIPLAYHNMLLFFKENSTLFIRSSPQHLNSITATLAHHLLAHKEAFYLTSLNYVCLHWTSIICLFLLKLFSEIKFAKSA